MLEYSAFTAPELWESLRASHSTESATSKWRLQLREIERAERAAKKSKTAEPPRGPRQLKPHVPWI